MFPKSLLRLYYVFPAFHEKYICTASISTSAALTAMLFGVIAAILE